jgi:CRP/FNR family transcriptional regulator
MRHIHSPQSPAPSDFLAQLAKADRAELEALGRSESFARGEYVFRAGDSGDNVYLLRAGRVKIFQTSTPGREIILWFCLPGDIFGLSEVARGGGRSVSALACEPCETLVIRRKQFSALVETRPRIAMLSMQVLSSRLRTLGDAFANLVADEAELRIAKLILRLATLHGERSDHGVRLALPLTHQDIANMAGTSRQTVTDVLNALKRRGLLAVRGRHIRISDTEELWKLVLRGRAAA